MSKDYIPNEYKNKAEEIMREMYKLGYHDGINDGNINNETFYAKVKEAYNNGLNGAWECTKKMVLSKEDGGLDIETLYEIFHEYSYYNVVKDYSAVEAIEKIKEYESHVPDKDVGEIKVGDEVKGLFIPDVTAEMFKNGCLESIEALMAEGELYDIECPREILRQMKNESD